MAVQPGLYQTWSKTPKTGFLTTRLILKNFLVLYFWGFTAKNLFGGGGGEEGDFVDPIYLRVTSNFKYFYGSYK